MPGIDFLPDVILELQNDVALLKRRVNEQVENAFSMTSVAEQQGKAQRVVINGEQFYITADGNAYLGRRLRLRTTNDAPWIDMQGANNATQAIAWSLDTTVKMLTEFINRPATNEYHLVLMEPNGKGLTVNSDGKVMITTVNMLGRLGWHGLMNVQAESASAHSYINTFSTTNTHLSNMHLLKVHYASADLSNLIATVDTEDWGQLSFDGVNTGYAKTTGAFILGTQVDAAGATYLGAKLGFYTGTNAAAPTLKVLIDSAGLVTVTEGIIAKAIGGNGIQTIDAGDGTPVVTLTPTHTIIEVTNTSQYVSPQITLAAGSLPTGTVIIINPVDAYSLNLAITTDDGDIYTLNGTYYQGVMFVKTSMSKWRLVNLE